MSLLLKNKSNSTATENLKVRSSGSPTINNNVSDLTNTTKLIQALVGVYTDGVYGLLTAQAVAAKFNLDKSGSVYNITKRIQFYVGAKVDGQYGPLTGALIQFWLDKEIAKEEPEVPFVVAPIFDERTDKILKTLDPKAALIFRKFIIAARELVLKKYGCDYKLISGNRTYAEQNALYAQGRTKPGKVVTNAKGGQSNHNFGIAVDAGVFKDGAYLDSSSPRTAAAVHKDVAKLTSQYGLEWGGDWTSIVDLPHFEVDTGYTMTRKRELMASKGSVL